MSWSRGVVAYLGRKEKALVPKVSLASYGRMVGVLWARLHVIFVRLMRSLLIFMILSVEKGVA